MHHPVLSMATLWPQSMMMIMMMMTMMNYTNPDYLSEDLKIIGTCVHQCLFSIHNYFSDSLPSLVASRPLFVGDPVRFAPSLLACLLLLSLVRFIV